MATSMTSAQRARQNIRDTSGKYAPGSTASAEPDCVELSDVAGPAPAEHVTIVNPMFGEIDRAQRAKAMLDQLHAGVEAARLDPQARAEQIEFASRFRQYSFNNALLIGTQCPGATHVAGKSVWEDAGGHIRKGGRAIWILAPSSRKIKVTEADGSPRIDPDTGEQEVAQRTWFMSVPVYDISDIEGVEVPPDPWGTRRLQGEAPEKMVADVTDLITDRGYTVTYAAVRGQANGLTDPDTRQVVIDASLSPRQQAKTLSHEAAHIWLGHDSPDQIAEYSTHHGRMETEAETASWMLSREYGLDDAGDYSFGYIAGWNDGDTKAAQEASVRGGEAGRAMLEAVHPAWRPEPVPELVAARQARQAERAATRKKTGKKSGSRRKR